MSAQGEIGATGGNLFQLVVIGLVIQHQDGARGIGPANEVARPQAPAIAAVVTADHLHPAGQRDDAVAQQPDGSPPDKLFGRADAADELVIARHHVYPQRSLHLPQDILHPLLPQGLEGHIYQVARNEHHVRTGLVNHPHIVLQHTAVVAVAQVHVADGHRAQLLRAVHGLVYIHLQRTHGRMTVMPITVSQQQGRQPHADAEQMGNVHAKEAGQLPNRQQQRQVEQGDEPAVADEVNPMSHERRQMPPPQSHEADKGKRHCPEHNAESHAHSHRTALQGHMPVIIHPPVGAQVDDQCNKNEPHIRLDSLDLRAQY